MQTESEGPDRFKDAIQRLDLWHANSYLRAVANELHGKGSKEARQWVKPLLQQIRNDQVAQVITPLEELQPRLAEAAAKAAGKAIEYYQNNQKRMKYSQLNFAPRIKIPVLLQGGKYDSIFPVEMSQKPLLKLFGTAEQDKHHKIYDTGHGIWTRNQAARDELESLNRYLGPTK